MQQQILETVLLLLQIYGILLLFRQDYLYEFYLSYLLHNMKEYLQELDEEETYVRMKIEELSIVQDDFMDDEF